MGASEAWRRRYAEHVLDETRTMLASRRVTRVLGDTAQQLHAIAMNICVPQVVDGQPLQLPGYEYTEHIPLICAEAGERFRQSMSHPTPSQRARTRELVAQFQSPAGRYYELAGSPPARWHTFPERVAAVTCSTWSGVFTDEHGWANGASRPMIALSPQVSAGDNAALVMLHELSHVNDILTTPLTRECNENRSLETELRAFAIQSMVSSGLFNRRYQQRQAHQVERIRRQYNGPWNSEAAFAPTDEIKAALATHQLDYIYRRTMVTNDDTTLQN